MRSENDELTLEEQTFREKLYASLIYILYNVHVNFGERQEQKLPQLTKVYILTSSRAGTPQKLESGRSEVPINRLASPEENLQYQALQRDLSDVSK